MPPPPNNPLPLPSAPAGSGVPFVLSAIMLVIYLGFILLVAYAKPFLGSTLVPGLSWGILLGALVIVSAWVLTFIYVILSDRKGGVK